MTPDRGAVVKGPDLFADHNYRPYVRLSDDSHPFGDEEALYAAVTTIERPDAIQLSDEAFVAGGLPRESYANPWTVVSIRHADIEEREGLLDEETTDEIATATADYIGAI
ncbi:hypothetical protein [Halolamina sediminis]|uniref:hypothetical protein n=1 Tax=Halolamina sediminis TaxID=1480675 RepID=UPI0006B4A822|nr:hypothetical protein [Halolamina sediminis]